MGWWKLTLNLKKAENLQLGTTKKRKWKLKHRPNSGADLDREAAHFTSSTVEGRRRKAEAEVLRRAGGSGKMSPFVRYSPFSQQLQHIVRWNRWAHWSADVFGGHGGDQKRHTCRSAPDVSSSGWECSSRRLRAVGQAVGLSSNVPGKCVVKPPPVDPDGNHGARKA